ncbi:hypothetical protein SEA_GODONK_27 [Gordonia phage GodonK]|uniref:Uncharacterized protein n=1 Tax=Gordonia phage GodonK TaxID=2562192 RepID=A0A4D6E1Z9_9CAUD|nr:hypothetical protein HOV33_gp027 [Gordonia phage GodonK]QBZ72646.1 hypothetical protein SEA_GODONK_27 [Gordonia phage GodonK]
MMFVHTNNAVNALHTVSFDTFVNPSGNWVNRATCTCGAYGAYLSKRDVLAWAAEHKWGWLARTRMLRMSAHR